MPRNSNAASPIEPDFKSKPSLQVINGSKEMDSLDRKEFGKPIRRHVLEFANVVAAFLTIIAAYKLWKGQPFPTPVILVVISLAFVLTARIAPSLLVKPWRMWLRFGGLLEKVMSSVILFSMWTLMFIPISLLLRVLGKKSVDTEFKKDATSYWETRDPADDDVKLMERQF